MSTAKIRKRRATKAEKKVAESLGGRLTGNSGAGLEKGDVRVPHGLIQTPTGIAETSLFSFRVEVKTTEKDYYALHVSDWSSIYRTAMRSGATPIFSIVIGITRLPLELSVIPTSLYTELAGIILELQETLPGDERRSVRISKGAWRIQSENSQLHGFDVPFWRMKLAMLRDRHAPGDVCVVQTSWLTDAIAKAEAER